MDTAISLAPAQVFRDSLLQYCPVGSGEVDQIMVTVVVIMTARIRKSQQSCLYGTVTQPISVSPRLSDRP